MRQFMSGNKFVEHGVVSRFWLVSTIEGQGGPATAMRVRADPGIFVSKTPGLDGSATEALHAGANHAPIDLGLANFVLWLSHTFRIYEQRDVEFRDVNLQ